MNKLATLHRKAMGLEGVLLEHREHEYVQAELGKVLRQILAEKKRQKNATI